MEINKIYCEPCEKTLARMVYGDFDNCVTSPPYFNLRDYNVEGQIGMENSPEEYVERLVMVFREVRRVMSDDGTLFLNLGDSYWGSGKGSGHDEYTKNLGRNTADYGGQIKNSTLYKRQDIKPKDLIGIPWMVAFALRADGWYLRQDIIWNKPNPMPESVTDRCTKAHEYIFLLTKSAKYYYDAEAIKEKSKDPEDDIRRISQQTWDNKNTPDDRRNGIRPRSSGGACIGKQDISVEGTLAQSRKLLTDKKGSSVKYWETANKKSVWTVTTKPFKEAHFAVYPEDLITPCVLTTRKGAVIYDPFGGSGTTGVVALRAGRKFIMSELNPAYVAIAEKRLQPYLHNLFTI